MLGDRPSLSSFTNDVVKSLIFESKALELAFLSIVFYFSLAKDLVE